MSFLLDLLYPRRCSVCGELLPFGATCCPCTKQIVRRVARPICTHCGVEQALCVCGEENGRSLRHITAPFLYTDQIKYQLRALKFQGAKRYAKPLGLQMALCFVECFPNADFDFVTFVPMTKRSQKQRGFNQSELLAKSVAKAFFMPVTPLLCKTSESEHQSRLSAEERQKNLTGKIRVSDAALVRGKTVLLCDDIKTTGATLWECEQALLSAGATDVYCLCCAVSDYSTDVVF